MAKFEIEGGKQLSGSIAVQGSKNAALPILAASLLCDEVITLKNVPKIDDVLTMLKILNCMGVKTKWKKNGDLIVDSGEAHAGKIPPALAERIRSSIFLLGSFLSRFKRAYLAYPGGCKIGSRPIDLHIKGLRDLGAEVKEKFGRIICNAKNMNGGMTILDFASVGATENLILASVFNSGETLIINAAKEPEIVDLANFINAMGGKVSGAGTAVIRITGVKKFEGCTYKIMPDRIVAGTILIAAAACGGRVELANAKIEHLTALVSKLQQNCCHITAKNDKITISSSGRLSHLPPIETAPYPAFATDLQSQYLVLSTVCKGSTSICENLFENRFRVVPELTKMGAKIKTISNMAVIKGVKKLSGAEIYAEDLRGGASLVIAGLAACGKTIVHGAGHVDRGYYKIEEVFYKLGADIKRI